jgi:hypothetical protein
MLGLFHPFSVISASFVVTLKGEVDIWEGEAIISLMELRFTPLWTPRSPIV